MSGFAAMRLPDARWHPAEVAFWVALAAAPFVFPGHLVLGSEERRVGKECRSRWSPYH